MLKRIPLFLASRLAGAVLGAINKPKSMSKSVLCLYSSSHKTYWPTAISHIGHQERVADIS